MATTHSGFLQESIDDAKKLEAEKKWLIAAEEWRFIADYYWTEIGTEDGINKGIKCAKHAAEVWENLPEDEKKYYYNLRKLSSIYSTTATLYRRLDGLTGEKHTFGIGDESKKYDKMANTMTKRAKKAEK